MTSNQDPHGARASLATGSGSVDIYRLDALERAGLGALSDDKPAAAE